MVTEKYITIPQLAKLLGISRIAVYKKVKSGQISAKKVGRVYVISDRTINKIVGRELTAADRTQIDTVVNKAIRQYGEVLKKLGRE